MKNYFSLIIIFFIISLSADELSWVDTQIEAIKPSRKGLSNFQIEKTKNPFLIFKQTKKNRSSLNKNYKKEVARHFILNAIINDSALINGKWYKLNSKIFNYKLSNIKGTTVILTKGKIKVVLTTDSKSNNIEFK